MKTHKFKNPAFWKNSLESLMLSLSMDKLKIKVHSNYRSLIRPNRKDQTLSDLDHPKSPC